MLQLQNASQNGVVDPDTYALFIEILSSLDNADPNNLTGDAKTGGEYSMALVRRTNIPDYNNPNLKFYDEVSLRKSSLWGQGAAMGLDKLLIVVEDAEGDGYKSRADIVHDFK